MSLICSDICTTLLISSHLHLIDCLGASGNALCHLEESFRYEIWCSKSELSF